MDPPRIVVAAPIRDVGGAERVVRGVRSLPRPVSSGQLLRSGRLKSRGSVERPSGARLSVVWGGSAPPALPADQRQRDLSSAKDAATKETDAASFALLKS